MPKYRNRLPQLSDKLFLNDGGLETTLIYDDGLELPEFASFHLMRNSAGRDALTRYYERHAAIAVAHGVGFLLESPTWRASADWGAKIGYSTDDLDAVNRQAIEMMVDIRQRMETDRTPMPISGLMGPRADAYSPEVLMGAAEAEAYHTRQIASFAASEADMVSAATLNHVGEAIGLTRAAVAADIPVSVSFTVETDGRLPTGQSLGDAIQEVDAATDRAPAYFMINCAHPTHFADTLARGGEWVKRLGGLQANASAKSHAELDAATELDAGDPVAFGAEYAELIGRHTHINVLGGCCGTDHRHIDHVGAACIHAHAA